MILLQPLRLLWHRVFIAGVLCALVSGCGAIKLTYNNADTLAYWWLDDYVDFSIEQKVQVKNELAALHQWHRQHQLSVWGQWMQRLQRYALQDVTPTQLCTWVDQIREQAVLPFLARLEPQALWLATNLTREQLKSIQDQYEKTNKNWRAQWQPATREELIDQLEKSIRERTDPLYGRLTESQRTWLREYLNKHYPYEAKAVYIERMRRQRDALITLQDVQQKKFSPEAAKEAIHALIQRNLSSSDKSYAAYAQRMQKASCELYAQLHNHMEPKQRAQALSKLKDYERDFKTLQLAP